MNKKPYINRLCILGVLHLAIFSATYVSAQSFSFNPSATITQTINEYSSISINVINNKPDTLKLGWTKILNNMTSLGWGVTLCDNANCYTSIPDNVLMKPIPPGKNASFTLSVIPTKEEGVDSGEVIVGTASVSIAVFEIGKKYAADTVTFNITAVPLGMDEKRLDNAFNIYPNPASDFINIRVNQWARNQNSIQIYNILGAKLIEAPVTAAGIKNIPLGELPSGVYVIRYPDRQGSYQVKRFYKD